MCKILKYNDDKLQKILKWFTLFYECSCELLSNGDLLFKWNFEFLIKNVNDHFNSKLCYLYK